MAMKLILIFPFFSLLVLAMISSQGTVAIDFSAANNASNTPGGMKYNNQIGNTYALQTLSRATNFIWSLFQQNSDADRRPTQRIGLVVVPTLPPNVIAASSNDIIQYSAAIIATYTGGITAVRREFSSILYHEVTHSLQWDGKGQVHQKGRGGLIEGIADFVRLKAGLGGSTGWAQPGDGNRWDQGYDVTARFLEYCESLKGGFVAQLNKKMRDSYDDSFFQDLLGKNVDQLWSDYKAKYGKN